MSNVDPAQPVVLQCPACGSREVLAYRQGIIRYRVSGGREVGGPLVERDSEDAIWHACVDCGYGSGTDRWYVNPEAGDTGFVNRTEIWQ